MTFKLLFYDSETRNWLAKEGEHEAADCQICQLFFVKILQGIYVVWGDLGIKCDKQALFVVCGLSFTIVVGPWMPIVPVNLKA